MTTQSQTPFAITPIIIQLPPQLYQQEQLTPGISNNTNTQLLASPNALPSIGEFLNNLNQKFNSNILYILALKEHFLMKKLLLTL